MNLRQDTIVSGSIPPIQTFALGGFVHDGRKFVMDGGYSMYTYGPQTGKCLPIVLADGWYGLLDGKSQYKPLYVFWKWAWDLGFPISPEIRYPIVFVCQNNQKETFGPPMLYLASSKSGICGLAADDVTPSYQVVFDLQDFIYDWNDGTFQLQTGNLMVPSTSHVVSHATSKSNSNGLPSGFEITGTTKISFLPLPVDWYVQTGSFKNYNLDPFVTQQCYRYSQLQMSIPDACAPINTLNKLVGVSNLTSAIQAKYTPYFISNEGCGGEMVSKVTTNLLGKLLPKSISGYGESVGYCIRGSDGKFATQLTPPNGGGSTCSNCTSSKCPELCSNVTSDPKCLSSVCGMCNPNMCPASFQDYILKESSLENSKVWVWIMLGIIIILFLGITGFAFYSRSYKDTIAVDKEIIPRPSYGNPQASYGNPSSYGNPPPSW